MDRIKEVSTICACYYPSLHVPVAGRASGAAQPNEMTRTRYFTAFIPELLSGPLYP